ncbi:PD-(D/E)XK nuclease family protein [Tsukamurella soli]|uniref:PD-(D/E)XK nuclease superfamily protein n=1 Tax=Tsukamurella soli TaxID=644556 RepID=A0ABP8JJ64_9ACTN
MNELDALVVALKPEVVFGGSATIPTMQYGNIQPQFTVSAPTLEEARDHWLKQMQELHRLVGKDLAIQRPDIKGELLKCWASGTEVFFDPITHTYTSPDGSGGWLSGSTFASRFVPEFPKDLIAGKSADKANRENTEGAQVLPSDVIGMWDKNAEASSLVGSAAHAALELRGKYGAVSQAVKGTYESALTKNPILRPIVESFFEGREDEVAKYEVFVADPKMKHCGLIDRLLRVGEKSVRVQDFKTSTDVHKPEKILEPFVDVVPHTHLGRFVLQLSFYARILAHAGWTVEGLDIFHWTGTDWDPYPLDVVDISAAL